MSPAKVKDGRVDPDEAGDPPLGILPSFKVPKGASPEERAQLKETKATYPWSYAFGKADEDFKLLQDHPDPQVQAVVEARLGVKSTIKETRTKRFYKIGSRGAFPVYLNYYGGHTGDGAWLGILHCGADLLGRGPTCGDPRPALSSDGGILLYGGCIWEQSVITQITGYRYPIASRIY